MLAWIDCGETMGLWTAFSPGGYVSRTPHMATAADIVAALKANPEACAEVLRALAGITGITCDTCTGPIPEGGEGHPEICPTEIVAACAEMGIAHGWESLSAVYGALAEQCRSEPGRCFCGCHVTPVAGTEKGGAK